MAYAVEVILKKVDTGWRNGSKPILAWAAGLDIGRIRSRVLSLLYALFRLALLIGLSFIVLYPLLRMFSMALRPPDELYDTSVIWVPKQFTLSNFQYAIDNFHYWKLFGNTLQVSVLSTLFQLISSSLVGYGFARYDFKFKKILFGLVIFTIVVPVQTVQLPLYVDFRRFDFFGIGQLAGLAAGAPLTVNLLGQWSLYLPALLGVGLRSGLYIFIFRQFFKGMPKDLENAAKIDGCRAFQTYLWVMLPNAVPAFVTVAIFSFVCYWNDYVLSSLFLRIKCPTLTYQLSLTLNQILQVQFNNGTTDMANLAFVVVNASAILVLAPLILMFIFAQKLFIESMDRSGIKG